MGEEPPKASLQVKSNHHDFGAYLSVVCYFDDTDDEATRYAYRCEEEAPTRWDTPLRDSDQLVDARTNQVCSACLAVAAEQGISDRAGQELLMMEMGGEMADHLCDAREAPDLRLECRCGCRSNRSIQP